MIQLDYVCSFCQIMTVHLPLDPEYRSSAYYCVRCGKGHPAMTDEEALQLAQKNAQESTLLPDKK